jgi:hypothetical protein
MKLWTNRLASTTFTNLKHDQQQNNEDQQRARYNPVHHAARMCMAQSVATPPVLRSATPRDRVPYAASELDTGAVSCGLAG